MTAVEFLHSEYKRIFGDVLVKPSQAIEMAEALAQAKEMEKKQMHKCASFWRGKENEIDKPIFQLYYNETFKK